MGHSLLGGHREDLKKKRKNIGGRYSIQVVLRYWERGQKERFQLAEGVEGGNGGRQVSEPLVYVKWGGGVCRVKRLSRSAFLFTRDLDLGSHPGGDHRALAGLEGE